MEHPVTQGSEAWNLLRAGRPTASDFGRILTPEWKRRTGEMPRTYLYEKLTEYVTGKPLPQEESWAMGQGTLLESEAIPYYEFTYDAKVRRVGFVTDDAMTYGCSPDGLIGEDGGIEAKCPQPQTHLRYLLDGQVPKDYLAQVHGCMFVTGRPWWVFMSYSRQFPPLVVKVMRDEAIQAAIKEALDYWLEDFRIALAKIESIQGSTLRTKAA